MRPLFFALGLLIVCLPAQPRGVAQLSLRPSSGGFGIQRAAEVCMDMSEEECCGEMLSIAAFNAQGDHLPRLVKSMVRLTCMDESRVVRPQVCKSILTSRGFDRKNAESICRPAKVRGQCKKNGDCQQCTRELDRLKYESPQNVCYAVTYTEPKAGTRVVKVGADGEADSDTRFEITKRRVHMR
ncbi:MAG: hypothetical protein OEZ06_10785 [Myxococcales bacterium]|nr:hypothetical protein [Myxococcales bacterium]